MSVSPKRTRTIFRSAPASRVRRIILSGAISQANLFGSGKFASLQLNTGKINRVLAVSTQTRILRSMASAKDLISIIAALTDLPFCW